jgi:hypothetical protein
MAAAAAGLNAFVLTEDMPLLYDLNRAQFHGRSLREALLACVLPDQPYQDLPIFGLGSGADGHIFMKFMPHEDVCEKANRPWFLFDAPGFASISYNGGTASFDVVWEAGGTLSLPVKLLPDTQYALCFNYSVGKRTDATIKVRALASDTEHSVSRVLSVLKQRPNGSIILMNSREKDVGWKGTLQNMTFGPSVLSKKVWRACHALIGVAPPTLTADLTLLASIMTEIKFGRIRRLSRQEVVELANTCIPGFYPGRGMAERATKWFD